MKEIKFRGLNGKKWIFGMPTYDFKYVFGEDNLDSPDRYEVDPKTVGQFIGLKDKNGVDIYCGDKIFDGYSQIYTVIWDDTNCGFALLNGDDITSFNEYCSECLEIIGSIHQKK